MGLKRGGEMDRDKTRVLKVSKDSVDQIASKCKELEKKAIKIKKNELASYLLEIGLETEKLFEMKRFKELFFCQKLLAKQIARGEIDLSERAKTTFKNLI